MSRKADPNSTRQKAFKLLDNMTQIKREDVLSVLKTQFKIGESYAASLHAAHRTLNKKSGVMVKVYSIRDIREGKAVEPYLKVINKFNPTAEDCLSPAHAKEEYRLQLASKIMLLNQL